jgi:hypothetical protein
VERETTTGERSAGGTATGTDGTIIDLEAEDAAPAGQDRRRALVIAFAMFLAVGSAFAGQDGATGQAIPEPTLALQTTPHEGDSRDVPSGDMSDVVIFTFPDRLANEPPPPMAWVPIRVRNTAGLAVQAQRPGEISIVTWTELGTVYRLTSDRRHVDQLIDLADKLR